MTDSELRTAHGGNPTAARNPGSDRQTIGGGTSVYRQTGTSIINPSGG